MGLYEEIINKKSKKKEEKVSLADQIINNALFNSKNSYNNSKVNYENQKAKVKSAEDKFTTTQKETYKNYGVFLPKENTSSENFINTAFKKNNNTNDIKASFRNGNNQTASYNNTKPKTFNENINRQRQADENKNLKTAREKLNTEKNQLKYDEYVYNVNKVANEKTTFLDKTLGVPLRGIADLFSVITDENGYKDSTGKTTYLPTYYQLKQDKVRGDYNTGVGKFLSDVSYNAAKIAGSQVMNMAVPYSGTATYFSDIVSDSYKNAINQGYNSENALTYAMATAGIEYITEKFLGGAANKLTGGKIGKLDEAISNKIFQKTSNALASKIIGTGVSEASEEFIQEYLDNINKLLLLDNETDISKYGKVFTDLEVLGDAAYSAAVGLTTGGAIGAFDSKSATTNVNMYKSFKEQLEERKKTIKDAETIKQYDALIKKLDEKISNPFSIDTQTTNETLNNMTSLPGMENVDPLETLQLYNAKAKAKIEQQQQIQMQEQQEETNRRLTILEKRIKKAEENAYKYEPSNNTKIDNLRKDAATYFNNSKKTNNFVKILEKIIQDKNVEIRLDANLGNGINGKYENGVITINPNSSRAGEFVAIHELTHAIGTDSMRNIIETYRKSNPKFNKAVSELLSKTYNTTELNEEAMSDIAGQLFGNQEFINNLSMEQPSLFKRIYNEIKYLWHQFTGYKNSNQFIEDLKNKWESAYRNQNKINKGEFLSKIYNNDGTINRIRIDEDIFKNSKEKSIQKTIKEYLKNHIGEVYTIIESGQKVYLGEDLPNEYAYSKSASSLPLPSKMAKGRATSNIGELIEIATNRKWEKSEKIKHQKDAKYGFYKYDTKFSFDHNGQEKIYDATLLIRNDADGKKYLYDILNIKPQKKLVNLPSIASNSKMSSARNDGSSNQLGNNISQSKENVKYSKEEESIQDKINQSMTMEEAREMLRKAMAISDITDYSDGEVKTIDDWVNNDNWNYQIPMIIDSNYNLYQKYINGNEGIANEEFTIDDVIEAYKNGTLTGKQKQTTEKIDTSKDTGFKDDRFYSPKEIKATRELYEKANQRVNNSNREEVYKARADFIIAAHDITTADSIGISQEEINKKIKSWANYTTKAMNLSNEVNKGVSLENRWSGLENSSIVNEISISNEEMESMVKEVIGKENSNGWKRQYITSTMLALNTHIDYSGLTFDFEQTKNLQEQKAAGDYNHKNNTIRIGSGYQNTVAHEIGHYVDYQWAREIFNDNWQPLSSLVKNYKNENLTNEQIKFVEHFKEFQNSIESTSEIGDTTKYSSRNAEYWQEPTEVFARFVGKFTEWVRNQATNNRYGYEEKHYTDRFTESQYKDFIKLLQEKSALDISTLEKAKYSKESKTWREYLEKEFKSTGTTTKLGDIKLPTQQKVSLPSKTTTETKKAVEKPKNVSIPMVKNDDVIKVESKRIADQINKTGGFDLKQRSWAETSTESDALKGKVLIKDLDPRKINYVVESNKKSLDTANRHLSTYGYEQSLADVKAMLRSDGLPKASDVALMQRMIQEAAKRGDAATAQNLIMDTAILGTDLGQATQALSMIKRLTPEGQLTLYTKLVQRAKARGEKSFENVQITPQMVQNVLGAYRQDGTYDQNDLNARVELFKQDLANQMKATIGDKVDAWRYLSMLGNPKTHIRNMVSNIAMNATIKVKNAMARTLETLLPAEERTKTWKAASQDVKEFARQTAINMKDIITGEAKYNEKSAIESKKRIFNNNTLEKLSNFNGNALEAEDWFFSKRAFQSTLQEYLTAKGINTYADIQNNPEIVEQAKNYAKEQAEIATFRQYSKLASTINQLEKKNKGAKLAIQALVPFKKTPINVAKAGIKYSPLGLLKTAIYDSYQLTKGNMEASQYIDNLSQGITGTSLALLGYALAKAGILSAGGDDDKEGKYDTQLGNTGYSLNIGGNSYSISWLSPVAMPMLVGASAYNQLEEGKEWDMNVVSDSLAKTLDPLNEMSFMQGVTNALNSYSSGVDKWKGIAESTVQNYVGQFFPTVFSQLAATTDDVKRSTKASANSKYKFGEQTVRSIMYKVPGLRQQLEAATDVWGNEKKQSDNIFERAFESFVAPYSKTQHIATELDKEIKRVYNQTGDTGVIPSVPYAYVKYQNETYRMSANEYTQYKKTYGQNANKYLNSLINSSSYKTASDEMKAKMISNVYDYVRAEANEEYFKNTDVNYTSDKLKEIKELREAGIVGASLSNYVADKTQINTINSNSNLSSSEKKQKVLSVFTNSDLNNKQLAYLYGKYYSTKEKVNAISSVNIPMKEFIKYDLQNFESNYNYNTGKAISNSKKNKIINYVNSLRLSAAQKALLIKLEYNTFSGYDNQIVNYVKSSNASFLDKAYLLKKSGFDNFDNQIISYVQKNYNTAKEKEKVLKSLGFTVRNGRVYK